MRSLQNFRPLPATLLLAVPLAARLLPARLLAALLPPCPIHAATGLLCPGCGATRAILALLHGQLGLAWSQNPLILTLLPFALVYALAYTLRRPLPIPSRPAIAGLLTIAILFGIARNLT